MRRVVAWVLGIALVVNGLAMLAGPHAWYMSVPGVPATGPFNPHFVRDIGVAYVVTGLSLLWFAGDRAARPAAMAGTAFLVLHAAVHLWDAAAGREPVHQLFVDTATIFLPAGLALWLVWPVPLEAQLKRN